MTLQMPLRILKTSALLFILVLLQNMPVFVSSVYAHPHVFIEANLEIHRNKKGEATSIRHVWRFDEIFSSSLILDFDDNGNGKLDAAELQNIAKVTHSSLSDYNFYTEVQLNHKNLEFNPPDPFIVDFKDEQLLMILSLELKKPAKMVGSGFRVAVSDPTYYVAVDFYQENAINVTGGAANSCKSEIVRPDFDALYERDKDRLEALYAAGPDEEVEGSEDYLTWVNFKCKK